MKYLFLITFCLLLSASSINIIKASVISGKFHISNIKKQVNLFESFSNGALNNFIITKQIVVNSQGEFSFEIKVLQPSIHILNINHSRICLFTESTDSIFISIYKSDSIVVFGKNAAGNNLLNKLSRKFLEHDILYNDIYMPYRQLSNEHFEQKTSRYIDSIENIFFELQVKNEISNKFLEIIPHHLKGLYISNIFLIYENLLYWKKTKAKSKVIEGILQLSSDKIDSSSYLSLRKYWYKKFNPLNRLFIYSAFGKQFCIYYLTDINAKLIEDVIPYDTFFNKTDSYFKALGFLTGELQENIWYTYLFSGGYSERNVGMLNRSYQLFKVKYPKSVYTQALRSSYEASRKKNVFKNKLNNSGEIKIAAKNITSLEDMSIVMNQKFAFIDIWATWCVPCVQEFAYKDELSNALYKRGVEIIYISIDNLMQKAYWEKFLNDKKLYGTHILAKQKLIDHLQSKIFDAKTISIPRYLLINNKGSILMNNLPRPNKLKELMKVIDSVIQVR